MSFSTPALLPVRVSHFQRPVYVEDKPNLTKSEKKALLKEAKRATDSLEERDYKTYSEIFNNHFSIMYEELIKHFLKIREIENESISQGDSRSKTIEKSSEYAKSVAKQYQPSGSPYKE